MTLRTLFLLAGLSRLAFVLSGASAVASTVASTLASTLASTGASTGAAPAESQSTWIETVQGLPRSGQWRNGFDLADFNGDGLVDLVHGPARRQMGEPVIFLGEPESRFGRWSEVSFPEVPFDYGDAAAADFDGDGKVDLAFGIHLRGLVVLLGDGRGGFSEQSRFLAGEPGVTTFSSRALAVGDLDGDGRPDLVALGEGPRLRAGGSGASYGVRVLLNRLPEAWDWRELEPASGHLFGDDLTLGDFDRDGRLDIATASHVQGQRGVVFWGAGDGDFQAAELAVARPASYIHALAAADFDGDGDDDLVVAYTDLQTSRVRSGLDLFLASPDRSWVRRELPWMDDAQRPTALASGDPDGDGDADLVVLGESGLLMVFENSKGTLEAGPFLTSELAGGGCRGYHVQLAELESEGRETILAGFADEHCPRGGSLRGWKWSSNAGHSAASSGLATP